MDDRQPVPPATDIFLEPQYRARREQPPAPAPRRRRKPAKTTRNRAAAKDDPLARLLKQRLVLLARIANRKRQGDHAGAAELAGRRIQLERQISKLSRPEAAKHVEQDEPLKVKSLTYRGPASRRRVRFQTGRGL